MEKQIAVIGAGVSGMNSALKLVETGYGVVLTDYTDLHRKA